MAGQVQPPRLAGQAKPGTFRHLCVLYYSSPAFKQLDASTQAWRRRALDAIALQHGDKPVARMEAKHVRLLRDERQDAPTAGNERVKALAALFGWGVEEMSNLVPHNPTLGVRKLKYKSKGIPPWTMDEIKQFRDHWAIGTKARLAMELLLATAGRCGDAVRLGTQHIRDGRLRFVQDKNENRNPSTVDILLLPALAAVI